MNSSPPEHVLDLDHSLNRATIEGAQPGVAVRVLVRDLGTTGASPIHATGLRSSDGSEFRVEVTTSQGMLAHNWPWELLLAAIRTRRRR